MKTTSFTPLVAALRLECELTLGGIYLKLESSNPTGTHKDRAATALAKAAISLGHRHVSVGTCGNLGVALARSCFLEGLHLTSFVPSRYSGSHVNAITDFGADIVRVEGTYEDAVSESQSFARRFGCFEASPAGDAAEIAVAAYEGIASEINAQLGKNPSSVWVGVGNGTTLGGLYQGFRKNGFIPRLGAVGSANGAAAIRSIYAGHVVELDPNSVSDNSINEPLINWRASQSALAIEAIRQSNGFACEVSDHELIQASQLLGRLENINVLPACGSGLAGFLRQAQSMEIFPGPHILILT